MHISPAMLEAAYCLHQVSPPFNRWKLPEADDIGFLVTASKDYWGLYQLSPSGQHSISVSSVYVSKVDTLLRVMAHEMIHLRQAVKGKWPLTHNAEFRRLASLVCRHHGYDVKAF